MFNTHLITNIFTSPVTSVVEFNHHVTGRKCTVKRDGWVVYLRFDDETSTSLQYRSAGEAAAMAAMLTNAGLGIA